MLCRECELSVRGLDATLIRANARDATAAHHDAPRVADELVLMRDQDDAFPPPDPEVLYRRVEEDAADSRVDGR